MTTPLFPIPPDWSTPVDEQLDWLTSLAQSPTGAEQRMGLRQTPRLTVGYAVTVFEADRQALDFAVSAVGGSTWLLPLWYNRSPLSALHNAGATTLSLPALYRGFQAGGKAVLMGRGAFDYEVVDIDIVGSGYITLAAPTGKNWPAGTPVHPLRAARLAAQPQFSRRADRAFQAQVSFLILEPNPGDTDWSSLPVYRGYPVLVAPPDEREELTTTLSRYVDDVDSKLAIPTSFDTAGQSIRTQIHRWMLHGTAEHAAFRSFLYAAAGRKRPLWLPTFACDFDLAGAVDASDTTVTVRRCGYSEFLGPVENHRDLMILLRDGTRIFRRITAAELDGDVEHLALDSAVGASFAPSVVLRVSLLSLSRLDADGVSISHLTDAAGVSTVALPLRSVPDIRSAPSWEPHPFLNSDILADNVPPGYFPAGVKARIFFADRFNTIFESSEFPLAVNSTTYSANEAGVFLQSGDTIRYKGAELETVLFLEMIAVDASGDPLDASKQPTTWSAASDRTSVRAAISKGTFSDFRTHGDTDPLTYPPYAGVRLEWGEDFLRYGYDEVTISGIRPTGERLSFFLRYIRLGAVGDVLTLRDSSALHRIMSASDDLTIEETDVDPGIGGSGGPFSLAVEWRTGGDGRDAMTFDQVGVDGIPFLTQLRDADGAAHGAASELEMTAVLAAYEGCYPPGSRNPPEAEGMSGTLNFAQHLTAPDGYEISLDESTWSTEIVTLDSEAFFFSYDQTSFSWSVYRSAVTVYYRDISAPGTVLTTATEELYISPPINLKPPLYKVKILTPSDAGGTGLFTASDLVIGPTVFDTPAAGYSPINETGSSGGSSSWTVAHTDTTSEGMSPISAGAVYDSTSGEREAAAQVSALGLLSIDTGTVSLIAISGSAHVEESDGYTVTEDQSVTATSTMTMTATPSFVSPHVYRMDRTRAHLTGLDDGDYLCYEADVLWDITMSVSISGSATYAGITTTYSDSSPPGPTGIAPWQFFGSAPHPNNAAHWVAAMGSPGGLGMREPIISGNPSPIQVNVPGLATLMLAKQDALDP